MQHAFRARHQRWRVFHHIAHRHRLKNRVELAVFELAGGRQNNVRMAGGFIDVKIDADHEIQATERTIQLVAIWARQHRVAGMGNKGFYLAAPRRQHFIGHGRDRKFTAELRVAVHPAAIIVEAAGIATQATHADNIKSRVGEHDPPLAVQIAGEDVNHIDQPGAEAAVGAGGYPHAGVHRRAGRVSNLASQRADSLGGYAHRPSHFFRGPGRHQLL